MPALAPAGPTQTAAPPTRGAAACIHVGIKPGSPQHRSTHADTRMQKWVAVRQERLTGLHPAQNADIVRSRQPNTRRYRQIPNAAYTLRRRGIRSDSARAVPERAGLLTQIKDRNG